MNKKRPKHLALHLIKLPLPGFVSILHRMSGALLFLALPLLLWALQCSLRSIETHTQLMALLQHPLSKLIWLGLLWSFLHHFFAGLRYLAIDFRWASSLKMARATSYWVMGVSLLLTLLIGAKLW
ncbi:MAG: succinate dehydrogenase, cytochrome b556 subunit [Gallionellaceae bacterium]